MRRDEVPQDDGSFYGKARRALWARGDDGRYRIVESRGWHVETVATAQAIEHLERSLEATRARVRRGEASPLAFHLEYRQMTPAVLAQTAGIARFRVRRHLKPHVFARLGDRVLLRYADALGLTVEALRRVPGGPVRIFADEDRS